MPNLNTLKSKVVLMLMASIVLVLVLIAVVSSFLVTRLHQTSAEEDLLHNVTVLEQSLEQKKKSLSDSGQRLQFNKSLIASTHLIWKYQDKSNYQPLIFDEEKQSLARLLEAEAKGAGHAFVGVYSPDGDWYAYVDTRKNINLYSSYNESGELQVKQTGLKAKAYSVPLTPVISEIGADAYTYYRLSDNGTDLMLVNRSPLVNPDKGITEIIAWIYIGYVVDKSFAQSVSEKTGAMLLIHGQQKDMDEDYLLASHSNNSVFVKSSLVRMKNILHQVNLTHDHELASIFMHKGNYFSVIRPMDLESNEHLLVAFGMDKENLSSSLAAFQQAIFVVLILSGFAVIPMGLYFARRTIINPVTRLTEFAMSLASGGTPRISGFSSKDELGMLADAFNTMAEAIQIREQSIHSKQREIESIIENAPSVISMKLPNGQYLMVNHLFEELFDLSKEEIVGHTDMDIFPEEHARQFRDNDLKIAESKQPDQFEESIMQAGVLHTYISNKFPLLDNDGSVIALCSIATDITERKNAELKLSLAKNIIDNANEAIVVTDLDSRIEDINEAYEKVSGYSREEVIGLNPQLLKSGHHDKIFYQNMWKLIRETGQWKGELWDRRKNGEVYPKHLSISTVYDDDGQPYKYVGIFSDITERKETEKQLKHLAYFDALTSLPNRVMFYDRLQQSMSLAKRDGHLIAILMVDLDRFKYVNDTLGHDAGDELLIDVAQQLKGVVRESDTVARIGGDEFKIILTDIKNADEASIVAQKIIDDLKKPIRIKGRVANIGASIGIAIYPTDANEIEQLIKYADLALYKAKETGRNCYQYFSEDLQVQVFDHIEMEVDMKRAIAEGEFSLQYQPKINLQDGSLYGVESLVRWQHPEKGIIFPDQFISFAEETGLIVPLGEWILNEACKQLRIWSESLGQPINMAINLSAIQFQQKDLIGIIKNIIDENGVNPEHIELEITESMVMLDVDKAIETMRQLRKLGLKLAIDDFGTGYSSLSYLKRFPINTLKIDRSFVSELTVDSKDAAMIRAVISMARDLEMNVVAEGVETKEQSDFLTEHGCQYVQGYYFSRPLDPEQFNEYIESTK